MYLKDTIMFRVITAMASGRIKLLVSKLVQLMVVSRLPDGSLDFILRESEMIKII
jgi:hypothetical protein